MMFMHACVYFLGWTDAASSDSVFSWWSGSKDKRSIQQVYKRLHVVLARWITWCAMLTITTSDHITSGNLLSVVNAAQLFRTQWYSTDPFSIFSVNLLWLCNSGGMVVWMIYSLGLVLHVVQVPLSTWVPLHEKCFQVYHSSLPLSQRITRFSSLLAYTVKSVCMLQMCESERIFIIES